MKKNIGKGELFRKIFAESRSVRADRLEVALGILSLPELPHSEKSALLTALNQATPIKIDLGNGWIECSAFGSIHDELRMVSYRPRNGRADCAALRGGIKLTHIRGAGLI